VAHAQEARPAECCGLLLGRDTTIAEAVRTPNASDDPNRFEIEPEAHIVARREARQRGLAVLGFYHSHPHSSPAPSMTDLLEASYPDHLYLIVGLASHTPQIRLFRYGTNARSGQPRRSDGTISRRVGGNFIEVPFVTAT
jgi:proteasome lid subunit RPN8/RPN11